MVDSHPQGISCSLPRWRALAAIASLLPVLVIAACSSGSGGGGNGTLPTAGNVQLVDVKYGRLVDVYGYRTTTNGQEVTLYQTDVPVGADIQDERPPGSTRADSEILYDFLSANPDNLQPRVLIPREIGSTEFDAAYAGLGRQLKRVTPGVFGQDTGLVPYSVVPRNAGIVLTFSARVPVTQSFFVETRPDGTLDVKNTEAVQLLEITGNPNDTTPTGDFRVIPTRVVVRDRQLILDPVLLGTEGAMYGVRNNASGMPASPNQVGANIRIALALQGPLKIPGLVEPDATYVGTNNDADRSIIRDFRSGNNDDDSADISQGFVRDTEPPRIVGEMLFYTVSIQDVDSTSQVVTVLKNGINQEIDLGDVIRFVSWQDGSVIGSAEVIADPADDLGMPEAQRVRVLVRRLPALDAEFPAGDPLRERFGAKIWDPSDDRDFPANQQDQLAYVQQYGTRAVLIAEYTDSRINPITNQPYGDDPSNFLSFSPSPLPLASGEPSPPNQNISPFAEAIIRFTKPVDLSSVRAFDTFFFATRNVLDDEVIRTEFLEPNDIDPAQFNKAKFATPHLVAARIIDEDGSQTSIRLQPLKGFYLDEEMRQAAAADQQNNVPFAQRRFLYYLHLLGSTDGIKDLAGNPLDFQSEVGVRDFLVIPFSLDARKDSRDRPLFADNLAVSIVRRYATDDEDEQPSLYLPGERASVDPNSGQPINPPPEAYPLQDVFGAVTYLSNGRLQARNAARVRKVVDDLNQQPPPPQTSELRFCPTDLDTGGTIATPTASVRFGQGIQNPLNPFGSRLQTCWREIDMSLSRVDPLDFNLDVEQMWWAPFQGGAITFDQFDRVSLFLGHSEWRPEPCVGSGSSLPAFINSGLKSRFADNYAHNNSPAGAKTLDPAPHPAYVDQVLTIDASNTVFEPNGVNRYLPLPTFQKPYFVWRDETVAVQGAASGQGSDTQAGRQYRPYIISPWLSGNGRFVTSAMGGGLQFNFGRWNNEAEYWIVQSSRADTFTGGGTGSIALPLLADFWTYCDDPDLPAGNGFVATGYNGWQIALSVQSSPKPDFRVYSGGFSGSSSRPPICIDEGSAQWATASGGYTPAGQPTGSSSDNSVYWVMADFLKRQTVVTAGFVDLYNPHRMPGRMPGQGDPRLGPYLIDSSGTSMLPAGYLPRYDWSFEPPLEQLPVGTSVVPEFRAASEIDSEPWRYNAVRGQLGWNTPPDETNFPLDPLKACDAGIHKYDDRPVGPNHASGPSRQYWAYYYNKQVTDYTRDIANLSRDSFTSQFTSNVETFDARDVRYFNWRFIMRNNVDADPPVSPAIDSFAITYRFERQ